jgi:hypothetical protein
VAALGFVHCHVIKALRVHANVSVDDLGGTVAFAAAAGYFAWVRFTVGTARSISLHLSRSDAPSNVSSESPSAWPSTRLLVLVLVLHPVKCPFLN